VSDAEGAIALEALVVKVEGRDDIIRRLDTPDDVADLARSPIVLKEGTPFTAFLRFRVQHGTVTGLRWSHSTFKFGTEVAKVQRDFASAEWRGVSEVMVASNETPVGMDGRGRYTVRGLLQNDSNSLRLDAVIEIAPDWP
jgi:hypothetical protein